VTRKNLGFNRRFTKTIPRPDSHLVLFERGQIVNGDRILTGVTHGDIGEGCIGATCGILGPVLDQVGEIIAKPVSSGNRLNLEWKFSKIGKICGFHLPGYNQVIGRTGWNLNVPRVDFRSFGWCHASTICCRQRWNIGRFTQANLVLNIYCNCN